MLPVKWRIVHNPWFCTLALGAWFPPLLSGCGSCCCSPTTNTGAQAAEQRAKCIDNMKRVNLAFLMYTQDYDERLPPAAAWMDVIYPYVKTERRFHCQTVAAQNSSAYGYAFNSELSGKSLADVDTPATVRQIYDSTTLTRSANDPVTSLPVPPRHEGDNIIGYADGHVTPPN